MSFSLITMFQSYTTMHPVIILFQIRYMCRCEDVTLLLIFFLHGTRNSYSQKTFGTVYKKVPRNMTA